MHAMQYEITLPADYDMGIIRDRVATRGHLLDDFPGLGVKAYLMRERGEDSPVNQYAPFYLWSTPEGMNSFLWSPGFQGVVRDFGRPEVRHWTGLSFTRGASSAALPRSATRRREPVPESAAPADAVEAALEESRRLAKAPGAVVTALAVDPLHWELVHFTLWDGPAPEEPGERFEVLHVSRPGLEDLGEGRQW
ncbi:DUF4865 family protein [Streptomyces sp. ITFR-6]|uniref:DUF4865 family protein n=1 Tax=Streptomyces sp. ITFR-6 TaxID=3075197 RepID=UPI00288C60F2|nr:DUF4865 family protein [Streptomyces sp. ITFR-6]WNI33621.1 DUF4865 family protein [Streptomyces sp. ITFR-6]